MTLLLFSFNVQNNFTGVDLVIQPQPPAKNFSGRVDSETYVHRSGRTGRAGQKGTCITLFTHPQEPLIQRLESDLKMKLKRIGAPQVADLVKHAAKEGKYSKRRCEQCSCNYR